MAGRPVQNSEKEAVPYAVQGWQLSSRTVPPGGIRAFINTRE